MGHRGLQTEKQAVHHPGNTTRRTTHSRTARRMCVPGRGQTNNKQGNHSSLRGANMNQRQFCNTQGHKTTRDTRFLTARRQHPKDGGTESSHCREWSHPSARETHHKSPACPKNWYPARPGKKGGSVAASAGESYKSHEPFAHQGCRREGIMGACGGNAGSQAACFFLFCVGARLSSRKQKETSMHASPVFNRDHPEQLDTGPW